MIEFREGIKVLQRCFFYCPTDLESPAVKHAEAVLPHEIRQKNSRQFKTELPASYMFGIKTSLPGRLFFSCQLLIGLLVLDDQTVGEGMEFSEINCIVRLSIFCQHLEGPQLVCDDLPAKLTMVLALFFLCFLR